MNSTKQPMMKSGRLTAKGCNCLGGSRGGRAAEKREWQRDQEADDLEAIRSYWERETISREEDWENRCNCGDSSCHGCYDYLPYSCDCC